LAGPERRHDVCFNKKPNNDGLKGADMYNISTLSLSKKSFRQAEQGFRTSQKF